MLIDPLPFQTPVLFLIFNRPNTTRQVFEAIKRAKPIKLYVAADGPRQNRKGDAERVAEARQIVTAVDWPCDVKILFRDQNLGCKQAVSSAIDWFFENEEQGIILEDDCLPHPDFFGFCETLLNRYAHDEQVWVVTGDNFQDGQWRGDAPYYFSRYNHVWGWASWRRAWIKRDMNIDFWPKWKKSPEWKAWLPNQAERAYWSGIFDRVYRNKINSWAYPWTASVWFHGGLTATPNVNLVTNIGFGPDATHTLLENSPQAMRKSEGIGVLATAQSVSHDFVADQYTFINVFFSQTIRFHQKIFNFARRIAKKPFNFYD